MSAQTIDFQADPARTANLASFRSTHLRKLLRRALPPTANRFCHGPLYLSRNPPPAPPARFARPREPAFPHRLHRRNLYDSVAQTNPITLKDSPPSVDPHSTASGEAIMD